jgi:hypothetical protein
VKSGPFVIDYTKTVQAVYIDATIFALVAFKGLEALSYVGDRTINQVQGLPSWVPDFSQKLSVTPFQVGTKIFSTGSTLKTLLWHHAEIPQCLGLNGICYDTVIATSSAHWTLEKSALVDGISNLYKLILNPLPVTSTTREELHSILRRTLIGDGFHAYLVDPEYDLEAAFDRWLFCQTCYAVGEFDVQLAKSFFSNVEDSLVKVREILNIPGSIELFNGSLLRGRSQCDSWEKMALGARGFVPDPTRLYDRDTKKDHFTLQWKLAAENRYIFRTEGGFLGLGLQNLRPGDRIYILQGAPVPYVFRNRDTNRENVFDLEGEAYVHGIMYGEALETGNLDFEKIYVY